MILGPGTGLYLDYSRRAEAAQQKPIGGENRVGKARLKLQEPDIAAALGMGDSTLRKYKRNPDAFSLGQLVRLGGVFGWTEEEYMDIITGGRGAQ